MTRTELFNLLEKWSKEWNNIQKKIVALPAYQAPTLLYLYTDADRLDKCIKELRNLVME